jgi:choline dehydrogenase-like flavoprotein
VVGESQCGLGQLHVSRDADCRTWDIRNLWICDGSVFPTVGGVNPSLTIQAIACRTADRVKYLAACGDL